MAHKFNSDMEEDNSSSRNYDEGYDNSDHHRDDNYNNSEGWGEDRPFKRGYDEDHGNRYNKRHHRFDNDRNKPRFSEWTSNESQSWNKKKKPWQENTYEEEFEDVPRPEKPRKYTVSIAIPASILEETCKKDDLRTYVVGQLARTANIYSIDEIVVYDDQCWRKKSLSGGKDSSDYYINMMRVILEYQECPQYLRKYFFTFHKHLSRVGVLNALNAPHHLLARQWCEYREGAVLDKPNKTSSYVDVGLTNEVLIDKKLEAGQRVTVKLPESAKELKKPFGEVVSPDEPREKCGYYWGYTVRVADSLAEVLTGSRFPDGYDLMIGTSDKGDDVRNVELTKFRHALIVFGGVEGLEAAIEADDQLEADDPKHLFNFYLNTCPLQQARTIRTEEAVLITLCAMQDKIIAKGRRKIK